MKFKGLGKGTLSSWGKGIRVPDILGLQGKIPNICSNIFTNSFESEEFLYLAYSLTGNVH